MDPRLAEQLKLFEEAMLHFREEKYTRARQIFEKITEGISVELADRARLHVRMCDQRLSRQQATVPRGVEDHYHQGVALMNQGRWDEAREHLGKALKLAPKADYLYYAVAALDCLTGEAESAMANLKTAIELRPENRYHARNDEDFAFLREDPRFTDLLYPERDAGD